MQIMQENAVFPWKKSHSWQNFYTTAGRSGRDKSQLCMPDNEDGADGQHHGYPRLSLWPHWSLVIKGLRETFWLNTSMIDDDTDSNIFIGRFMQNSQ